MGSGHFFLQVYVGNDWLVIAIAVGLLLPVVWVSQNIKSYRIFLKRMVSFKSPGNELTMAGYSFPGNIAAAVSFSLSMASILYCLIPDNSDVIFDDLRQLHDLGVLFLFSAVYLLVRMLLYSILNPTVYRRMRISRDQYLWPVFCQMMYMIISQVLALFSMAVLFFGIPPNLVLTLLLIFLVLMKSEVVVSLYNTLFGGKRYYFVFFAYLCAVELAPAVLGWFALNRIVLIF